MIPSRPCYIFFGFISSTPGQALPCHGPNKADRRAGPRGSMRFVAGQAKGEVSPLSRFIPRWHRASKSLYEVVG